MKLHQLGSALVTLLSVGGFFGCSHSTSSDDAADPAAGGGGGDGKIAVGTDDLSARAGHREVESIAPGLPRGLAMTIDAAGVMHAAFIQNQGTADRVVYLTRQVVGVNANAASLNTEEVTAGAPYLEGTGIALDPRDGEPFIAFFDRGVIKVAHRAGPRVGTTSSSWEVEVVETDVGASQINPTPVIKIAADGTQHITYSAFATPPPSPPFEPNPTSSRACLKHASRAGNANGNTNANGSTTTQAFKTEIVDCGEVYEPNWIVGSVGIAAFALDKNGGAHVCYAQSRSLPPIHSNDDLKYAFLPPITATSTAPSVWKVETVEKGGHRGGSCSIALDSEGRPNISQLDWASYDARFSRKEARSNEWVSGVIESNGAVGRFSQLMFDKTGTTPHVAYIDEASGALRLASSSPTNGNAAWEIENVRADAHAFGGGDMVSALDANNEAHFLLTHVTPTAELVYVH